MRWLSVCSILVWGCGAEAALSPERTGQDVTDDPQGPATDTPAAGDEPTATDTPETGTTPAATGAPPSVDTPSSEMQPVPGDRPMALQMIDGRVEIRGLVTLQAGAPTDQPISVGLRWVLEESLFPRNATTGIGPVDVNESGEFALLVGEPLAAALVANEATEREGVGVAYLTAYVDGDANGILGCENYEGCRDVVVGGSPNAMVVYAEEAWPAEGEPLFGFDGAAGVRPASGWSLVHMTHNGGRARPTARPWAGGDDIELVIMSPDGSARDVQLDVD